MILFFSLRTVEALSSSFDKSTRDGVVLSEEEIAKHLCFLTKGGVSCSINRRKDRSRSKTVKVLSSNFDKFIRDRVVLSE
jgi:hypothetical protein